MTRRGGDIALVATIGLFWGLNWPAVKVILGEVPPWTLRTVGLSLGAALLFAIAGALGQRLRPQRAEFPALAAAGLFSIFGFNIFAAFGQLFTETSKAAIVAFTMPMWAALFAAMLLGERLTPIRLLALAVGLAGLGVLIGEDLGAVLERPAGIALMLGAAVSWALGTVLLKSRQWSLEPLARASWLVVLSVPPMAVGALVFEDPFAQAVPSPAILTVLAYHVIFPMTLCHGAWVTLVHRLPASVAAIGTLLVPVVGVLSATLLLGEPLTGHKLVALLLVLASITASLAPVPGRKGAVPRPPDPLPAKHR